MADPGRWIGEPMSGAAVDAGDCSTTVAAVVGVCVGNGAVVAGGEVRADVAAVLTLSCEERSQKPAASNPKAAMATQNRTRPPRREV